MGLGGLGGVVPYTPWKINMEPENRPLEKVKLIFQINIFRFYVNISGVYFPEISHGKKQLLLVSIESWLVHKDHSNGLLKSPDNWVV